MGFSGELPSKVIMEERYVLNDRLDALEWYGKKPHLLEMGCRMNVAKHQVYRPAHTLLGQLTCYIGRGGHISKMTMIQFYDISRLLANLDFFFLFFFFWSRVLEPDGIEHTYIHAWKIIAAGHLFGQFCRSDNDNCFFLGWQAQILKRTYAPFHSDFFVLSSTRKGRARFNSIKLLSKWDGPIE